MSGYSDLIVFNNHLKAFLDVMKATPEPSKPDVLHHAIEMWEKVEPNSPIHVILKPLK